MKIYIGPYVNYFGPYQLAEKILFWLDKDSDRVYNLGKRLSNINWVSSLLNWIHSMKKQKTDIRIDKHDTWDMSSTLAQIILPMLKQLKTTRHGSPNVEDKDVPKELRRTHVHLTSAPEWETDANWDRRWEWVMDEMIYAFEAQIDPWAAEEKFSSGVCDLKMVDTVTKDGSPAYTMKEGPNHTYKTDKKGLAAHQKRVKNGLRLFGTYYQGLWD